ncbi:MAG: glycosyltransferase family 2 protein [Limisphaerales bacterium]
MNIKSPAPTVSVIILNWNAAPWTPRCLESLREQTIFSQMEIIFADNASTDDSEKVTREFMMDLPNGHFVQNGGNFGYGGGCNRGVAVAQGKYLFFLNPDVWLESNCLEELVKYADETKSKITCPIVMDYDTHNVQTQGEAGFDFFGCLISPGVGEKLDQPFTVATFFFIEQEFFQRIGWFDEIFFLYVEEMDLSWRAWIAGESIKLVRTARMHHATSGSTDQKGRTSEARRFYANRNQILTILKNARGPLLLLALNHIALITVEAMIGALLARKPSFIRWSLFEPLADCWRLRGYILSQRRFIRGFRQRGDWWIARRFFRFGFGHWMDIKRFLKSGVVIDKSTIKVKDRQSSAPQ